MAFRTRIFLLVFSIFLTLSAVRPASAQTLLTTQTPAVKSGSFGGQNYEKGLAFYSVSAGQVSAVRFWKASNESGTHVGKIWSSTGTLLASVTFINETASGWQQQSLSSPLSITANTNYIVSVNTTNGYVAYTDGGLNSQIANGSLRSVVGNNGRWGSTGQYPANGAGGINYFRDIVFVAAAVSSISLNPATLAGGATSTATVTLTNSAPSGGAIVALSSNNVAAVVPGSVTIPAGSTSRTFIVNTAAVPATASATITASYNGSKSAALLITAPALSTLTLNPNSVTGGGTSTGTLTLTSPAPSAGAVVALSSSNAAAVVPGSVTVPAGATTQTFSVSTNAVSGPASAMISATYNGSASVILTVSAPVLSTLTLNPNSVTGGSTSTGMVTLNGPAPVGGVLVALSGVAPVLQGIQGVHSAANFPHDGTINWSSLGPLSSSLPLVPELIAGLPGSTITLATATSALPQILDNCTLGGNCGWYGNFAPGESILWVGGAYDQSTGNWIGNAPLTMTFSSPQRALGFDIMADELGPFTATLCAYNSSNTLLACIPFTGIATNTADGSAPYVGLYDDVAEISKVTIDAGGALFPHDFAIGQLYVANSRRPMVPASVIVPAGATGATFTVSTSSVQSTTLVNISGAYVNTRAASLSINPPALSNISLIPNPVTGGAIATGSVSLTGSAPVGGVTVALLGANPSFNGVQTVQSLNTLPNAGSIDWSAVAPAGGSVSSGVSQAIAGVAGAAVTISTSSGLPTQIANNCSGGNCGWYGNFAPGATILWTGGTYNGSNWIANGPLMLSFNTPQRGLGFQIMPDELGPFTANLCAYDSNGAILKCVPFSGNSTSAADGSAIFIGLYDDVAEISKVTVDAGGAMYPHDFAIGKLYVMNVQRQLAAPSATIPAGDTSTAFAVTPNSVSAPTSVTFTGSYNGSRQTTLQIQP